MAITGNVLSFLIFFPLFGALAILFLKSDDHLWIRRISLGIGIIEFLVSFLPVWLVTPGSTGFKLEVFHHWISAPNINFHLGVDGISMFPDPLDYVADTDRHSGFLERHQVSR